MPEISIIVPVYNAEKYLRHCIESILAQTFTDFELLLINDGSSDSSELICDEYARIDKRVKVYHKKNGGVSTARNLGLEKSRGKYITFSDSDDLLVNTAFQTYIDAFSNDCNIDVVKTGYYQEPANGNPPQQFSSKHDVILDNKSDFLSFLMFDESNYNGFLWNECLRKEIVEKHRFDESINWCEDHIFSFTCFYNARKIYISKSITYRYQIRANNSLSKTSDAFVMLRAMDLLYNKRKDLLETEDSELISKLNKSLQSSFGFVLQLILKSDYSYADRLRLKGMAPHKDVLVKAPLYLFFFHMPLWMGEKLLYIRQILSNIKSKLF